MSRRREAKIIVDINRLGCSKEKFFVGTEDEVFAEACDWMHQVALQFIEENDIEDQWEQDLVFGEVCHTIEWQDDEYIVMYAVIEKDSDTPVFGIYASAEIAQEVIEDEAKKWVQEVMATEDSQVVLGTAEWDYEADFPILYEDCLTAFEIQEVPVYGIEEIVK